MLGLAAVLLLLWSIFWVYQFVQLMLLSEADFPGRYDKVLWTVAFVLAFFVAPVAFFGWKFAYRAMRDAEQETASPEP